MAQLILGIDIGTSSVKTLVTNHDGAIFAQAEAPNQLFSPHIGWSEESTDQWKNNVIKTIRQCLDRFEIKGSDIAAVGVSGMVPAVVLLNEEGETLRRSIQQNDARAGEEIIEFESRIGAASIFKITGARLSAQSVGPKLVWLQRNEPGLWLEVRTIMGSYDYINYVITGSAFIEKNWALESGLYDIEQEDWSAQLLDAFNLNKDLLPLVREPTDIIGKVSAEFAHLTGLQQGIPVIAGSADHIAAALAAGINTDGDVLIKFGSAGDILYCSDALILDEHLFIDYHNIPGKFLLNGCMATSGSLLKWYVNEFCSQDREIAQSKGMDIYAYLDAKSREIGPGAAGVVVLPYFLGEKTPIFDTNARGVIFGLSLSHNRDHIYRAVLEAVVFGFLHHIEFLKNQGLPISRVVASEGGARSPLWRQIAADILNHPIQYLRDNPGSAYGAALVAGVAVNLIPSWQDIAPMIRIEQETQPKPDHEEAYQKNYRIYRALYPKLKALF